MPSQQFQSTALLYKTISKQLSTAAADAARKSAIVPHPTQAPTSCPQLLFLPSWRNVQTNPLQHNNIHLQHKFAKITQMSNSVHVHKVHNKVTMQASATTFLTQWYYVTVTATATTFSLCLISLLLLSYYQLTWVPYKDLLRTLAQINKQHVP